MPWSSIKHPATRPRPPQKPRREEWSGNYDVAEYTLSLDLNQTGHIWSVFKRKAEQRNAPWAKNCRKESSVKKGKIHRFLSDRSVLRRTESVIRNEGKGTGYFSLWNSALLKSDNFLFFKLIGFLHVGQKHNRTEMPARGGLSSVVFCCISEIWIIRQTSVALCFCEGQTLSVWIWVCVRNSGVSPKTTEASGDQRATGINYAAPWMKPTKYWWGPLKCDVVPLGFLSEGH